jgi:hypothetical protein
MQAKNYFFRFFLRLLTQIAADMPKKLPFLGAFRRQGEKAS